MKPTYPTIGVVGTGAMGRGIAQIAAQAGSIVKLYDTNPQAPAQAVDHLAAQWDKLADNCQRYLAKGRKVAVVGSVSVSTYEGKDGTRFSLDVRAEDVEFLSPREQSDAAEPPAKKPIPDGFQEVDDESLPF